MDLKTSFNVLPSLEGMSFHELVLGSGKMMTYN